MKQQMSAVAALFVLCMTPIMGAHAQSMDIRPYIGTGIGAFGVEYKDSAISQKKTGLGGFIKAGADIGDYLGAELRIGTALGGSKTYAAGGALGATAGTFKASADYFFSYLGKLQAQATHDLKPYLLFGATTAKFKTTNSATAVSASKSKTGFSYGIGVDYILGNQLSVNGEWMQYLTNVKLGTGFASAPGTNAQARLWGAVVSLNYHF